MQQASAPRSQQTILIVSQVYPPDPTAVGQHIADVAERLASDGWRVVVFTASRGYDDPSVKYARRERRNGVDVRRLPLSSFGKTSISIRLIAGLLYCLQTAIRGAAFRHVAAVVVSTSPPFSNIFGVFLSWIHRAPLTWWVMDLNPDQMIQLGRLKPSSFAARVFDWLNRATLRRAQAVVVLDDYMKRRVEQKARPRGCLRVLPPWSHEQHLADIPHDANPFRSQHGLHGKLVVMYSGNHGLTNPLDTLLEAAEQLADEPRIVFVFIGGGVRKHVIEEHLRRHASTNILSLPYQPLSELQYSLAAADLHVVSVSQEAVGVSHSCKIYGAMSIGRPILALAPRESHVADILERWPCGWLCQHGAAAALVAKLREIAELLPQQLQATGAVGRDAVRAHLSPDRLITEFCDMVTGSATCCQE
jgi:colanic acid biosynthesis glycosyl transferase WcaI